MPTLTGPRTPHTGACAPGLEDDPADRRDVRGAPCPLDPDPDSEEWTSRLEKYRSTFIRELRRLRTAAASCSVVCCRSILLHCTTCSRTRKPKANRNDTRPKRNMRYGLGKAAVERASCTKTTTAFLVGPYRRRSFTRKEACAPGGQGLPLCCIDVVCGFGCGLVRLYPKRVPTLSRTRRAGGGASYRGVSTGRTIAASEQRR